MDRILGFPSPFVISYRLITLLSLLHTRFGINFVDIRVSGCVLVDAHSSVFALFFAKLVSQTLRHRLAFLNLNCFSFSLTIISPTEEELRIKIYGTLIMPKIALK